MFTRLRTAMVALGLIAALASGAFMQSTTAGDPVAGDCDEWIWDTDCP